MQLIAFLTSYKDNVKTSPHLLGINLSRIESIYNHTTISPSYGCCVKYKESDNKYSVWLVRAILESLTLYCKRYISGINITVTEVSGKLRTINVDAIIYMHQDKGCLIIETEVGKYKVIDDLAKLVLQANIQELYEFVATTGQTIITLPYNLARQYTIIENGIDTQRVNYTKTGLNELTRNPAFDGGEMVKIEAYI